jgi:peptidoglycan hydrolase CwlO-like protein
MFTHKQFKSILTTVRLKQKNMPETKPHTRSKIDRLRSTPVLVISSIIVICIVFVVAPLIARADSYQDQINALNQQNSGLQSSLSSLQGTASNYQQVINSLEAQISDIQSAISSNEAKQASIQQQITANEQQIAQDKQSLGDDVKTMYVNGSMTPIEQLATSQNLSQYVDQQVAYNVVQDTINSTITKINNLQASLKSQQNEVNGLLQTEQTQNSTLSNDQSQENQLLAYNQQQQNQYNQQVASNTSQIAKLQAQQAAANASIARAARVTSSIPSNGSGGICDIGQGNGGYPMNLCNAYQDSLTDSNGFPNRECTSFAAWYFKTVEGHSDFSVSGNAGWWYLTSNYTATTWGSGVTPGALGIEPSSSLNAPVPSLHGGYYGHVMVVLALPGTTYDGSLPYTSAMAGTQVPSGYVLVMSMNEDEAGHFMYNFWPVNYLMYINP